VVVVVLLLVLIFSLFVKSVNNEPSHQYSEILDYFDRNQVKSFDLDLGSGLMHLILDSEEVIDYKVPNVNVFLDNIDERVRQHNIDHPEAMIEYNYEPVKETSWISALLPNVILIVIMVAFYLYMARSINGGPGKVNSFSKARVKHQPEDRKTLFSDVAGADEEKEELKEVVEFLKSPKKYNDLGARIPKGVLLIGPPGTGKTLLARAVAGEAGVPFFSISGSDFVEMYVGVGASRVRDLFDQAKKESPSMVFIDEIDAVGRQRGTGLGGGHDEREQTLNQLLVEMDGFGVNSGVIVIAATNRSDILDPALMRAGRFDRQIVVNYPDVKGREEILKVHTRSKPLGPDIDLDTIARTTVGFTGADLENICNEAALLAARKGKKAITMTDMEEATVKVVMGPEKKSKVVSEKDKKITSYHEAGHAVANYYCPTHDPVHEVSIIPRGMAGGYTMSLPAEDKAHMMQKEMFEDIVVALGGRLAEKIIFDDISTGASSDISKVTKIAKAMVARYGFSDRLGPILYGSEHGEVFLGRDFGQSRDYSEQIASEIDQEVKKIVDRAYAQCEKILTEHIDQLHKIAEYLFVNEKLDADKFRELMEQESLPGGAKPLDTTDSYFTFD
jgi:cell division protease FtsH